MKQIQLVFAALLMVGTTFWLQERERAATARAVAEDLQEAALWKSQERWDKAFQSLERAQGRLAGSGPVSLKARVEERRREVFNARLGGQAVRWLRADVAAWRKRLEMEPDEAGPEVQQEMQQWEPKSFKRARGRALLAQWTEAERQEWQKLWEEVEELKKRAGEGK